MRSRARSSCKRRRHRATSAATSSSTAHARASVRARPLTLANERAQIGPRHRATAHDAVASCVRPRRDPARARSEARAQQHEHDTVPCGVPLAVADFNDGFGGGDDISHNLVFSTCRESGDHGPLNSWDRQPFLTTVRDGTPSMIMAWRTIHHNFFIDNYSPQVHARPCSSRPMGTCRGGL